MTSKPDLFPPLPPGVNRADPELLHWRIDRTETEIRHLSSARAPMPLEERIQWARLALFVVALVMSIAGLISPQLIAEIARAVLTH